MCEVIFQDQMSITFRFDYDTKQKKKYTLRESNETSLWQKQLIFTGQELKVVGIMFNPKAAKKKILEKAPFPKKRRPHVTANILQRAPPLNKHRTLEKHKCKRHSVDADTSLKFGQCNHLPRRLIFAIHKLSRLWY